jgi:gamma-glutamylcyclotransferase (GGCT)/AIG2-like uncharacterized protein YtfP
VTERTGAGDPRPPRLFVYGTLIPGRLRWPLLAPYATAHRPAAVPGRLFDSGQGWPVATFDPVSPDLVPGVVVELDVTRLDECLCVIDEVEDTATDELRRVPIVTGDGVAAWAYHYTRPVAGLTPIARWDAVPLAAER